MSQSLPPRRDNTLQGFTDQMESSASEIAEKLEPVRAAAKYEAENIGHAVSQRPVSCTICMQLFVVYKHCKLRDKCNGTEFESQSWYRLYSWCYGFSVFPDEL